MKISLQRLCWVTGLVGLMTYGSPIHAALLEAEYFIGMDPGEGSGIPLSLGDNHLVTSSISPLTLPASLAPGTHTVSVRVKDEAGRWSTPAIRRFTIHPSDYLYEDPATSTVTAAEYFIGADPGEGAGLPIAVLSSNGPAVDLETKVLDANLPDGTHTLGIRVQDNQGRWSHAALRRFTIFGSDFSYVGGGPGVIPRVVAAEMFFNTDPGEGSGLSVPIANNDQFSADISPHVIAALAQPGTHNVNIRVQDALGRWSQPLIRRYTLFPYGPIQAIEDNPSGVPAGEAPVQQVHHLEAGTAYACNQEFSIHVGDTELTLASRPFETPKSFFDRLYLAINQDPRLSLLLSVERTGHTQLTLTALSPGLHPVDWVRTSANLSSRMVTPGNLGSESRKIVAAEYFLDQEGPGGTGSSLSFSNDHSDTASTFADLNLPLTGLRPGTHTVGVRYKNAAGEWGAPGYRRFRIYSLENPTDTVGPEILLTGGTDIEWPLHQVPFVEPGYTAHDNLDGDLTAAVLVEGFVNPEVPGAYGIDYTVSDLSGNVTTVTRTVQVTYAGSPVITGESTLAFTEPPATIDLFLGLEAQEAEFGDLSHSIELVSSNVDWFSAGSYEAQFQVMDPAGNIGSFTRTVLLSADAVFYPTYAIWISGHGALAGASAEDMDPLANPDGDNLLNIQEWEADTNPFDPYSTLFLDFYREGGYDRLVFHGQHRIRYELEASPNLTNWSTLGDPMLFEENCLMMIDRSLEGLDARQFYRLEYAPRQPVFPDGP